MTREFTHAEADRHNALTTKGWSLTEGQLVLQGQEPSERPGWYTRWRLRRAARCFEQALEINPDGWSSMYALGKIHQRLGDQETAFAWFAKGHALKPDQPGPWLLCRHPFSRAVGGRVVDHDHLERRAIVGAQGRQCSAQVLESVPGRNDNRELGISHCISRLGGLQLSVVSMAGCPIGSSQHPVASHATGHELTLTPTNSGS